MSDKEATARIKINKLLEAADWRFFQDGDAPANIRLEPSVKINFTDHQRLLGFDLRHDRALRGEGRDGYLEFANLICGEILEDGTDGLRTVACMGHLTRFALRWKTKVSGKQTRQNPIAQRSLSNGRFVSPKKGDRPRFISNWRRGLVREVVLTRLFPRATRFFDGFRLLSE